MPVQQTAEFNSYPDFIKVKVFVYGSLMKGLGNHRVMAQAGGSFLSFGETSKKYRMISFGGFPGVVRMTTREWNDNTNTLNKIRLRSAYAPIVGEIYEVPFRSGVCGSIDLLEGHPHFYRRQKVPIKQYLHDNKEEDIFMYILEDPEDYPLLSCPPVQLNKDRCFDWRKVHNSHIQEQVVL